MGCLCFMYDAEIIAKLTVPRQYGALEHDASGDAECVQASVRGCPGRVWRVVSRTDGPANRLPGAARQCVPILRRWGLLQTGPFVQMNRSAAPYSPGFCMCPSTRAPTQVIWDLVELSTAQEVLGWWKSWLCFFSRRSGTCMSE